MFMVYTILSIGIAISLSTSDFHYDHPTEKDWEDIKFGVENQVDFYAVSFVKDADVVHELKDYLKSKASVCCHFILIYFKFGIFCCHIFPSGYSNHLTSVDHCCRLQC